MDEEFVRKTRTSMGVVTCFLSENLNQFPCNGGPICDPQCTFLKGGKCQIRELSMAVNSIVSCLPLKNEPLYEIRAKSGWVSAKKFKNKVDAENTKPWVAYILSEKEEDIEVHMVGKE